MPPSGETARAPELRVLSSSPLRVVDVALWYGERSGGIRTYLDAKVAHAERTGAFEHHVIVPGRRERHEARHHELPSLRVATSNGYRLPLTAGPMRRTLRAVRPDVVLLHDPYWAPVETAAVAHEIGARVVAVHHASSAHNAHGLPGPTRLYQPILQSWFRHAYGAVDGIMSAIDPGSDSDRPVTLTLRFGLDSAFFPRADGERGRHVLYVGRLSREKGVFELLEAAALEGSDWPLTFVGTGPAEDALAVRARRLGLSDRVELLPFVNDRETLADVYAAASCVVMPGAFETFGLVALEAAACGARVVACRNAPSAALAPELVDTFSPGDVAGLARAVARARAAPRNLVAAERLTERSTWERAFEAEIADLERLVGARPAERPLGAAAATAP